MAVDVRAKRIYDPPEPGDGYRVLVDHIWPRGVSREAAQLDEWRRELAPSDELRRWFDHVPERFNNFRSRYRDELTAQAELIASRSSTPRATKSTTTASSSPTSSVAADAFCAGPRTA